MNVKMNKTNVGDNLSIPELLGEKDALGCAGSLAEHGRSGKPANGEFLLT